MPEISQPKFEHAALEKDIERLSREIGEYKAGTKKELPERDILKSVIGQRIQGQQAVVQPNQQTTILPEYMQKESPEARLKVEELIDLTLHKGIDISIEEAKKYGPFVLDALHDALTTKIYDELKSRKLI